MKKIFSTIIVVLFVCASAYAQGGHQHRHGQAQSAHNHAIGEKCEATIHGHVTDTRTKEHIPYITVTIDKYSPSIAAQLHLFSWSIVFLFIYC